jgi:UDP-2,3-diacylglucosamine hydrolase
VKPRLPEFPLWQASASWRRIDLLSDVHLHAAMPRTFEAWKSHLLNTPADAVVMLGDLFEVWVGDDVRHDDFEATCTEVLRACSQTRALAFMPGNRDFLVGPEWLSQAGIKALADPTVLQAFGQRYLLSHGDALCITDTDYLTFRAQVRSDAWQTQFLRQPLQERQRLARAMREASIQHQSGMSPQDWADVDNATALQWLIQAQANTLVHGHTHRPARHPLDPNRSRWVLSDWDLDHGTMNRASVLTLTASGLQTTRPL